MMPEVDLERVPRRYLRVALVCLDQGQNDFGFVVLVNAAVLESPQKERDLLIDALEKFCAWLRGPSKDTVQ